MPSELDFQSQLPCSLQMALGRVGDWRFQLGQNPSLQAASFFGCGSSPLFLSHGHWWASATLVNSWALRLLGDLKAAMLLIIVTLIEHHVESFWTQCRKSSLLRFFTHFPTSKIHRSSPQRWLDCTFTKHRLGPCFGPTQELVLASNQVVWGTLPGFGTGWKVECQQLVMYIFVAVLLQFMCPIILNKNTLENYQL